MNRGTKVTSTFHVARSQDDTDKFEINIGVSDLRAENLSLQTWSTAQILANRLWQIDIGIESLPDDGIQVLELGAGTGLAGLSAAVLWQSHVVLTDLDPIVPGLVQNISSNENILRSCSASASCGTLDWDHPANLVLHVGKSGETKTLKNEEAKASIIIVADCIYSEEHPELLTKAIFAWLRPGKSSRLIISYPLRVAYLDALRELWARLEAGGLEAIEEGKEEIADEWDDESLHEWSVWHWKTTP